MVKSDQGASFVQVGRLIVTLDGAIPEEERSQSRIRVTPDQQHTHQCSLHSPNSEPHRQRRSRATAAPMTINTPSQVRTVGDDR